MGLEPTTTGITIRYSNQLSYTHRGTLFADLAADSDLQILLDRDIARRVQPDRFLTAIARVARPTGLEPATVGLEGRCSIRLSYGRIVSRIVARKPRRPSNASCLARAKVVGVEGFEPPTPCSQSRCATRLRYTPPLLTRRCAIARRKGPEILRTPSVCVNPDRRLHSPAPRQPPRKDKGCRSTLSRCIWRARRDSNSRPPSS